MKLIKLLGLAVLLSMKLSAQDAYQHETNGYFSTPMECELGMIATDNLASNLYLIEDDLLSIFHRSLGCGRYMQLSNDRDELGFKYIQEDGLQAPAVYNLIDFTYKLLHPPTELCGQVTFLGKGYAYTIGDELVVQYDDGRLKHHDLGEYVNIISANSSNELIAFCTINGKLKILDVETGEIQTIDKENKHFVYPKWSPNGAYILLQSGEEIWFYNHQKKTVEFLSKGVAPSWSENSKYICFAKEERKGLDLINSDIYLFDIHNGEVIQLTNTESVLEMQPAFGSNDAILYHTYNNKSIVRQEVDFENKKCTKKPQTFKYNRKLPIKNHSIKGFIEKTEVTLPNEVPYIHQVYDTRTEHYGYGSCAPSTCIMGLAYYNILPPWPTEVDNGIGAHINDYGSYVSERYRYNEQYYTTGATTSGGDVAYGGYGFMWGNGSPSSTQRNYIQYHGLVSDQQWTSNCSFQDTKDEIDQGYVHPICSYLTTSGHVTLASGYIESQYTVIFADPYGDKNTPNYPSYDGQKVYYDWPGYNNGYQNLDATGAYGYVPWTTKQQYVETTYHNTIIDDIYYKHGFSINNSENNSHQRYFRDAISGYNNHLWYTMSIDSDDDVCWVIWQPNITEAKLYDVKAYIPQEHAEAENVLYKVNHKYGTSKVYFNQNDHNGQWLNLGRYYVSEDDACTVQLGDETGRVGQKIAFDAVKWEKATDLTVAAGFHVSSNKVYEGNSITFHNSSMGAVSYEWLFEGGVPNTSTETHPVVTYAQKGFYDVRLIAISGTLRDTLELKAYVNAYDDEAVKELANRKDVVIAPNPCQDYACLYLNTEVAGDYKLLVFDANGREVRAEEGNKPSAHPTKHIIETETWNGNYVVKIIFDNKEFSAKIIVQ